MKAEAQCQYKFYLIEVTQTLFIHNNILEKDSRSGVTYSL